MYGFIEPDHYELYHGPDDCGVYCMSRGEAGVEFYWTGVDKCDYYEGDVVPPRTGSDEPVDSVVCTTGSDEPVNSIVYTTRSDEPVDSVIRTPGPDESVTGVTPCWTGDEEYDDYGRNVVLPWTGCDELVGSVVRTAGCDEPVDRVAVCVVTTGVAFQQKCDVSRGSVCDYDDYFYDGHYDERCCLMVVYVRLCLSLEGKQTCCEKSLPGSLRRRVQSVGIRQCTVTVYITSDAMAFVNARGGRPRVGVSFRYVLWNAPESFVTLDLSGVVVLDTSVVPNVLGMRARYPDAELTRVLPGRAKNSVRVLIPDARATPRGFHDDTLVDMTGETGPTVSVGEMCNLRRQWPTSLLTGMTRRQTGLALRRDCKSKFHSSQAGCCTFCRRYILHDIARHVSTYHLDLGQLWRYPVSSCSQWKGTPQDCSDYICARDLMGISVKIANLGKWFPPWTVTRSVWNTA